MPTPRDASRHAVTGIVIAGRYRLMEVLGSGGMGVVWLAHDELLRRRVAVKELRHSWGSSERTVAEGRERSLREARAAAALHHPHIVAVYDIAEHDDRPWIVMELVSGQSLKEIVVGDGPMPLNQAVEVGLQLLSALHAAHTAGITHRDVKPANVLIAANGVVRLSDFGLATTPDAETLTESGVVLGTPGYLAPEQANGLPPGPPADIFGLGATLYFAIEGVGPFHRDAYLPMLVAYTRHEIRPPERAAALAPVLLQLLAADPEKRPTAEQAREMLLGGPVRRTGTTRRRLIAGGATATAAVAAGALGVWWQSERSSTDAGTAPSTPKPRPVGVGAPYWQRVGLNEPILVGSALIGAADGTVRSVDTATGKDLWVLESAGVGFVRDLGKGLVFADGLDADHAVIDAATGRKRAGNSEPVSGVGTGILLNEEENFLRARDALTGKTLWVVSGSFGSPYYNSPKGILCAGVNNFRSRSRDLHGVDCRTGAVKWKTPLTRKGNISGPWGGGDQVFAVVDEGTKLTLTCLDVTTGKRRFEVVLTDLNSKQDEGYVSVTAVDAVGDLAVASVRDIRTTLQYAGLVAAKAGVVQWFRPLLNPTVAATADGRLFAASYDSVLHELDPVTGKTVWSMPTPGPAVRLHATGGRLFASIGQTVMSYTITVA
ncbi:protein kinase [Actinoplanes sp. NPDC051346]|uniref:serine/threonine-protein kinase n=1 Tax=Actinoplanes sp. NPDC051346 TaxID=3155048 RepID=UPI00341BDE10